MTEYEYYSASQKLPNTNTSIIRFPKNDQYEYEYYSVSQKGPNMNTNTIRFSKNDQIRILFRSPKIHSEEKSNKCKQCEYAVLHAYQIHNVGKIFTNAKNVILHFWSKKFEGAFGNAQTCREYEYYSV